MKKQDWIDYFEAVNGRSPEPQEVEAALLAGEFSDEAPVTETPVNPEVSQGIGSSHPEGTTTQGVAHQEPVVAQQAVNQQAQEYQQASFAQQQNTGQQTHTGSVPPNQGQQPFQFQQGSTDQGQQVYTMQVAVPSPFVKFVKQFWAWFLSALKSPTRDSVTHKYNGITAFGLLVFFTALTISVPFMKARILNFSSFISILVAFSFIFFAFILGGFIVKRVVYKETKFTLAYSFEWFGRLLSPNIGLMALAAFCSLINLHSLVFIAISLSYFIFIAASAYSLYSAVNHTNLDLFYKLY